MKALYLSERGTTGRDLPQVFRSALSRVCHLTEVAAQEPLPLEERLALMRAHQVYLAARMSSPLPRELLEDFGQLRYLCAVIGSIRHLVDREFLQRGLVVTNWGDAPAAGVAEGALTLLLAVLKDLRHQTCLIERGGWQMDLRSHGGSLFGMHVGLYGCGLIGCRFLDLLRPFGCTVRVFDPYVAELPADVLRAASLEEMFAASQVVVIHAGLTAETRGTVTARLLAMLPDNGILINTARGGIVDQEALFAELASGRLRAGLDVLEPDSLPEGHPARRWDNLILTAHQVASSGQTGDREPEELDLPRRYAVENLKRFALGQPLEWVITPALYDRMT